VQRRIDEALETRSKRAYQPNLKRRPIATHGNRLVSMLVFQKLPTGKFQDPGFDLESVAGNLALTALVDARLEQLLAMFEKHYAGSMIPTLFKNLQKCEHLADRVNAMP
jgi:hypothetical protein